MGWSYACDKYIPWNIVFVVLIYVVMFFNVYEIFFGDRLLRAFAYTRHDNTTTPQNTTLREQSTTNGCSPSGTKLFALWSHGEWFDWNIQAHCYLPILVERWFHMQRTRLCLIKLKGNYKVWQPNAIEGGNEIISMGRWFSYKCLFSWGVWDVWVHQMETWTCHLVPIVVPIVQTCSLFNSSS